MLNCLCLGRLWFSTFRSLFAAVIYISSVVYTRGNSAYYSRQKLTLKFISNQIEHRTLFKYFLNWPTHLQILLHSMNKLNYLFFELVKRSRMLASNWNHLNSCYSFRTQQHKILLIRVNEHIFFYPRRFMKRPRSCFHLAFIFTMKIICVIIWCRDFRDW